jgi:hypothetical protein
MEDERRGAPFSETAGAGAWYFVIMLQQKACASASAWFGLAVTPVPKVPI